MRRRRSRTTAAVSLVALSTALLAACGQDDESGGGSSADGSTGFEEVTIQHAYGETVISEKPDRIASVAWANHEVPIALGVVPVGMSEATYGDDNGNGLLPWVEEKLDEMGAETPVLFDETEGIDFEAVADTAPDVILASYSGLSQEEYDTLSEIAPTVAFPEVAWATTWQQMVQLNSEAIGMAEEGEQLVADLEEQVAAGFAEHPELEDKSVLFSYLDPSDLSQVGFYTLNDTRPEFLADAGMEVPALVQEETEASDEFYATISAEEADRLEDTDVLISYGDEALLEAIQEDPLLSEIPAVRNGAVALYEDSTPLAASANPTPLSIPYNLDEYLSVLADAASNAR